MKLQLKNWEWKKIGEVCEVNPSKRELQDLDENTTVSFIPMASVSEQGKIISQEERSLNAVIKGFTYFREGDVLIAKITPCFENGKRALAKSLKHNVGFGTTEFHVLRPKNAVIAEWIFYAISSSKFRKCGENNMTGTAGQKRIPRQFLENYQIPVPPLPIQKKIVSILERAESLKQKREQADGEANRIIQSIFYKMFGDPITNEKSWAKKQLKDIASIQRDSIVPENIKNMKYVGLEHIESTTGNILEVVEVNKGDLKSNKFIFDSDCVLYGKLRPYLNKIALPNFGGICSTDILPIKPIKGKANKFFIAYLLKNPYYVRKATDLSTGANLPRLGPKQLESFEVYIPPISLQNKFAFIVEKIESIKQKQSQATSEINTLFDALMQKAFNGELVK